jgi:RNA polymerase sigma factor (TIGR02999 family)
VPLRAGPVNATQLLTSASRGDRAAADRLTPVVYDELRELAHRLLPPGRGGDLALQPTALVHEAYLRLIDQVSVDDQSRTHFVALSAKIMRGVLVDHVRKHCAQKRGGGWRRISLHPAVAIQSRLDVDVLDLDDALNELARLSERAVQIVVLRFFSGMSVEEVAKHLRLSARTVKGDWRMARAWLQTRLADQGE